MSTSDHIDVDRVLAGLKPFQRRSVEYVFERLYGANSTSSFLLADEVGLGKTMVARGVVAKAITHLQAKGAGQVNIVYVCSSGDIARQNVRRLNPTTQQDFELATRITRLPEVVHDLGTRPLNFISFTPGTSFNYGHATGQAAERRILYHLLRRTWRRGTRGTGLKNLLEGSKDRKRFRRMLEQYDPREVLDRSLAKAFSSRLREDERLARERGAESRRTRLLRLCAEFRRRRTEPPRELAKARNALVGELRAVLAAVSIDSLRPDLVILDEFQRFKDLLLPDSAAGALARHLFSRRGTKVLLLSATPYKMYTLAEERNTDDHYKDFSETLRFLLGHDEQAMAQFEEDLAAYGRVCLLAGRTTLDQASEVRSSLEARLRHVMCRTEKLAVTADRGGMLREVNRELPVPASRHVKAYLEVRRIGDVLDQPDVVEYWKSSPYLLNFMDGDHYSLKSAFKAVLGGRKEPLVREVARTARHAFLNLGAWYKYREVDLGHPAVERLAHETVGDGWARLLWLPPSLPYYRLAPPFSAHAENGFTKRLVFSGWHVVPRALSVLLSYEAERQMIRSFDPGIGNTETGRERLRPLLTFDRRDGVPAGMFVLALVYPSPWLARLGDTLALFTPAGPPTLTSVLDTVKARITAELTPLTGNARRTGADDQRWYWAAPILMDERRLAPGTDPWFRDPATLARTWSGTDDHRGWVDHVHEAAVMSRADAGSLGRPPADLADVLALLAVAGPAVTALRGLAHVLGGPPLYEDPGVRHAAGRMAFGVRSLFNSPETTAMIRGLNAEEPYWRRALEYCAAGGLQSVVDEYLHTLFESEGLVDKPPGEVASALAERAMHAAGLRAATPGFDRVETREALSITNQRARARFAMRFGDERSETDTGGLRKDEVRYAFNSPFWPFVLATTSIGQEGLDFHTYCHAVMHWNLPNNPVDMEQREGRVHRFKGHAVRKNVAQHALQSGFIPAPATNPWPALFAHASDTTAHDSSGIHPFWVFPGKAFIERHTGAMALSREASLLPALRASLAVYRMVFGQPRQDDLLAHLQRTVPDEELSRVAAALSIRLEPPHAST